MIDSVSIENFKCFKNTQISGFKLFNLIGGKNNVGKSNLLEAMYSCAENDSSFIASKRGQPDSDDVVNNSLFYENDISNIINIKLIENSEILNYLTTKGRFTNFYAQEEVVINKISSSLVISKDLQYPNIHSLSEVFDKAERIGEEDVLLKSLQIIDADIEKARTFSDSYHFFIKKKKNKVYLPLFSFGDALQKIMRYAVTFYQLNKKEADYKCLFIDEIENGLHYTAQEEFWTMLFNLALEFKVQIFATSHSLEMIRAFNKVAHNEKYQENARYFEMYRHLKTNEIGANAMTMEQLHFEISKNQPFRGE
jgi:AAA15 family ATPase/GTPase